MLNVVMLSFITLSVVMLSIVNESGSTRIQPNLALLSRKLVTTHFINYLKFPIKLVKRNRGGACLSYCHS